MLYFFYDPRDRGTFTLVGSREDNPEVAERLKLPYQQAPYLARLDFKRFEDATLAAVAANRWAEKQPGCRTDGQATYIAVDSGLGRSPRYDVIRAPQVGDPCSYSFNGDTYPDGHITHVTPGTLRIIRTSGDANHPEGHTYYRRKQSGAWVQKGGTWGLVRGHIYEQNPHI